MNTTRPVSDGASVMAAHVLKRSILYSSDPLEYDGHGAYCPLMVAYVPDGSMGTMSWAHIYRVRMNRGTGILFTDPYIGNGIGDLMRILGITGHPSGNPWSARKFLDHVQSSSFDVPHIGARIGFARPWIFPLYIGRAWRNRTRSTGVDGDRTRPVGISPRQITVRHCVGLGGR